jgi:hypothetical protein
MIAALLALSQVTIPAGPSVAVEPATGWQCHYADDEGGNFHLSGVFPEFPAGSPSNVSLPTQIDGAGPAFLLGTKKVNSYSPKDGKRQYQVSFSDATGDRYNLNFLFAASGETPTDITHWKSAEQRLVTFAAGTCVADFNPVQDSK